MSLPVQLNQAVAAPHGGKITLVVGAGCSVEPPTSIPLSAKCSKECHDRLVADGALQPGDCPAPENLSALADAVVAKTGSQVLLVNQLRQHYHLGAATPNSGHLSAVALLREGALGAILTLNFDLALTVAVGQLGVGDLVGVFNGPHDFDQQKSLNLYYLHGNANAVDPAAWTLTTAAIEVDWQAKWQQVITERTLASPVVVFAGLGSPADVLVDTAKRIRAAIPAGGECFQVDPSAFGGSGFSTALGIPSTHYIELGWCRFMADASDRLAVEQLSRLCLAAEALSQREGIPAEELDGISARLRSLGLVKLGQLRSVWLLGGKPYRAEDDGERELLADLLLAVRLIERQTGADAVVSDDGVVEFKRGGQTVSAHILVSGKGTWHASSIEANLSGRARALRSRATPPIGAIVAGVPGGVMSVSPPIDVLRGETRGSIADSTDVLPMVSVESLRQDPASCGVLVP